MTKKCTVHGMIRNIAHHKSCGNYYFFFSFFTSQQNKKMLLFQRNNLSVHGKLKKKTLSRIKLYCWQLEIALLHCYAFKILDRVNSPPWPPSVAEFTGHYKVFSHCSARGMDARHTAVEGDLTVHICLMWDFWPSEWT